MSTQYCACCSNRSGVKILAIFYLVLAALQAARPLIYNVFHSDEQEAWSGIPLALVLAAASSLLWLAVSLNISPLLYAWHVLFAIGLAIWCAVIVPVVLILAFTYAVVPAVDYSTLSKLSWSLLDHLSPIGYDLLYNCLDSRPWLAIPGALIFLILLTSVWVWLFLLVQAAYREVKLKSDVHNGVVNFEFQHCISVESHIVDV